MNELITINCVRGRMGDNGAVELHIEDVARGLGFTRIAASGNAVVRWERLREYLVEFGTVPTSGHGENSQQVGKDGMPEFIPENIFYKLCFKASNDTARAFQDKVTDEVLPSIRKHGAYMTPQTLAQALQDPAGLIQVLTALQEEQERSRALQATVSVQHQQIAELRPKAGYYDVVLGCKDAVSTNTIAKDFGKSAKWLNKWLHEQGVQYKQGEIWLLYQKYAEMGYTCTRTHPYVGSDGEQHSKVHTYWTQKGRLFIYDLLKASGILPTIEREKKAA